VAREKAQSGDLDGAIPVMRTAADDQFREGQLLGWSIPTTGALVETLLDRGAEGDLVEAEAAIKRFAEAAIERLAAPSDGGSLPARSGCCGCGLFWRGLTAMTRPTRTCGIATATWRKRLASRGISIGPRRCHDRRRCPLRDTGRTPLTKAAPPWRLSAEPCLSRGSSSNAPFRGGTGRCTLANNNLMRPEATPDRTGHAIGRSDRMCGRNARKS